jgi:hypothetical protein
MGDRRGTDRVLVRKPERRDQLQDQGVDGQIILKMDFKEKDEGVKWIVLAQDNGQVAGFCKRGNELSGSIKCGEFLE